MIMKVRFESSVKLLISEEPKLELVTVDVREDVVEDILV